MKLHISPDLKIKDIQNEFRKSFPYLKLGFFGKNHTVKEPSLMKDIVPDTASLMEISGIMSEGEIEIRPGQTVAELEQLFQNKFSLFVQVFRKMGFAWIETTKTNYLTLEKQIEMGKESLDPIIILV